MTSQILAIFYLNDLDHYIKEELKIKYYIRYQDDFCLMHPSKQYLKECKRKIEYFLAKEKLKLNQKTRIYSNKNNYLFLGRTTNNKKGNYREKGRKIKRRYKDYQKDSILLYSMVGTILSYRN
mgnify:FL=1